VSCLFLLKMATAQAGHEVKAYETEAMAVDDTVAGQSSVKQNTVVFRGWGLDQPGIAHALLTVVVECDCKVLDYAQFLLEGSLMFTFVLNVDDQSSMKLMKALTKSAHDFSMQVNFHFPESDALHSEDVGKPEALISLVSLNKLSPALLLDIDTVLCQHECVVHDIDHRSDNNMENSREYNKFAVRVGCPAGLSFPACIWEFRPAQALLMQAAANSLESRRIRQCKMVGIIVQTKW